MYYFVILPNSARYLFFGCQSSGRTIAFQHSYWLNNSHSKPNENKFDYLAAVWALLTRFVFLCDAFICVRLTAQCENPPRVNKSSRNGTRKGTSPGSIRAKGRYSGHVALIRRLSASSGHCWDADGTYAAGAWIRAWIRYDRTPCGCAFY